MNGSAFEEQMQAVEGLQSHLAEYLEATGADEVVVELQCLGTRAAARTRTLQGETIQENAVPEWMKP